VAFQSNAFQSNAFQVASFQRSGQAQATIWRFAGEIGSPDAKLGNLKLGYTFARPIIVFTGLVGCGNAQADIKQVYRGYASAQGYIKVVGVVKCGQTQAYIRPRVGMGQARAFVYSQYPYIGLVMADSPDGFWKLDDASGTVAVASVGTDGTYSGSLTYHARTPMPQDVTNFGITADGNDRMQTNISDVTDNFTIEAWTKPTIAINITSETTSGVTGNGTSGANSGGQNYLWFPDQKGNNRGIGVSVGTNGIQVYAHGDGNIYALASYSGTLPTVMNHIVVTVVSKQPKIYLNGQLVRTGLTSGGTVYRPTNLLQGAQGYGLYLGTVNNAALYGSVLTDTQILNHYNAGVPKQYGQAQAYISNDKVFGQAQANIIGQFTGKLGSSLSRLGNIKLGSLGDHVGASSATIYVFGQAQAWIKAISNAFGQSQGDIKQVYQGYGQSQADIKQTYQQYGQGQADIKQTYQAFAQSQADITAIGYGFGQSNASLLGAIQQFGQAQADIKQTYQQYAQGQADIKAISQAYGQSQAQIVLTIQSFGQSNADILATIFKFAQSNADILATSTKSGQTQARLVSVGTQTGQTQARILNTDIPEGYWRLDDQPGLVAHAVIGPDGTYRASGTTFRVPTPMPQDGVNFGVSAIGPANVTFPVLDVTNNFSFEIWVKPSVDINLVAEDITGIIDGPQNFPWFTSQRGGDRGAGLSVGRNGIQVVVNGDNAFYALASYAGTLPTHINHVAVTFTNKQPKIYLNGVLVRTGLTETANFVYRPSRLFGNSYSGIATNAALYNTVLTDAQVLAHYNAGIPKGHGQARAYVNPAGVVFSNVTSLIDSPIKVQSATVQADILRTVVGCAQTQAVIESRYVRRVIDDGATHLWKLNEDTGASSAYDSIPVVPKTGTYTGTPISVDGPPRIGDSRGARFDGDVNNFINFADATNMPTGSMDRTIELWFRSSAGNQQEPFGYGSDSQDALVLLVLNATTVQIGFFFDDPAFTSNVPLFDGLWHTVVFTYTNRRLEVFVDGISIGTATTFTNLRTTTQQFTLVERNGNEGPLNGDLALVATYQKVLTNTQIVDHALGYSSARMGQAQARILSFGQTVFVGQAQTYIGHFKSGQAQAFIGHKQFAQAQAKIFYGATQVFAQAQAKIGTIRGYGQARAFLSSRHKQANGQAQGNIRSFKQKLFAQSNALIIPTPKTWGLAQALIFNGVWYGQAAASIKRTEPTRSANARAKIFNPPTGQAAAIILVQKFRQAQAQADIKAVTNGFGNTQAQITNMQGFGQTVTKIWSNVDNPALGLAQSYIGLRATGSGQARVVIIPASVDMIFTDHLIDAHTYVIDNSVSVVPIDMSLYSSDVNDPDIIFADDPIHPADGSWINSYGSFAPNGWLRFVLNTRSRVHIDSFEFLETNFSHDTIVNLYTGDSNYGSWTAVAFNDDINGLAESLIEISLDAGSYVLQVGMYEFASPMSAHWNIAVTPIVPVSQVGQAMASIFRVVAGLAVAKIWSNVDNPALGLAAAYIANNKIFGQAAACIRKIYFYDFFDRTTSAGDIGVSTDGTATYTTSSTRLLVDGSELVIPDTENFTDIRGYPLFAEAVYQFDFKTANTTPDFVDFNSYVEFDNGNWPGSGTNADDFVFFSSNGDTGEIGTKNTLVEIPLKPATWYTVKAFLAGSIGRTVYLKAWERGTPEPEWMAYSKVTSSNNPFNYALWIGGPRFGTGNTYLDNLLIYSDGIVPQFQSAQAQAVIVLPHGSAQAQALIRRNEGYGNAKAKILLLQFKSAQAQARIKPQDAYAQKIYADTPALYWPLDELLRPNNSVGFESTVWDVINGFHGVRPFDFTGVFGGTPGIPGTTRTSVYLPNTSFDFVYRRNLPIPAIPTSGSWAWEFWFKPDTIANSETLVLALFGRLQTTQSGGYSVIVDGNTHEILLRLGAVEDVHTGIIATNLFGSWHHVAVTRNSADSTTRIYIDAVQVGSTTNSGGSIIDSYMIGGSDELFSTVGAFHDEHALYTHLLTLDQLRTHYFTGLGISPQGYGQAAALILNTHPTNYGQAQAYITPRTGIGQAQAAILATLNRTGQARASIVYFREKWGNAQAIIVLSYQQMAQAKARINAAYSASGQAQAQIGHVHSGQANARIRGFNVPHTGQAVAYIYDGVVVPNPGGGGSTGGGGGILTGGTYIVKFNGYDLPGYAQSETMDSQLRIEKKYSLTESVGLGNKNVDIKMRLFEQDYITAKSKLEYASTILRSKRRELGRLYIQRLDRYYSAITTKLNYSKNASEVGYLLDYEVEWETKPWLISNNTYMLEGSGDLNTDSVARTLYDGGWTPARVTITGTDVTISGYTETGDFAGYIAVSGSVTNLVIDTESYTATIGGVNANQYLADYEYGLYIGPGKTNFTITGASNVQIKYENRWYL
jgi:hypothetical protein